MMFTPNIKKIRVGFVAPCVGIGGADMFMLSLMRMATNLEFTGIAIGDHTTMWQYQQARSLVPDVPFWQVDYNKEMIPGMNYDPHLHNCISNATENADVIISWCMPKLPDHLRAQDKPVIEIAQNCDRYAAEVCASNDPVIDFRVAVSRACVPAFPRGPVEIIYNGIDPGRCVPRIGRETLRAGLGLEETDKLVLFMGRYVDEKYPQCLINALQYLPPNWKGLYVGKGYRFDDLKSEAERYCKPGRIYFMEPQQYVGDILAASDAFLLVSDFEGLSLAMLEAWFARVPTVVSAIDSVNEMEEICGERLAYKVPLRASGSMIAASLQQAVEQTEENARMLAIAHQLVWNKLTTASIGVHWEDYILECINTWYRRKRYPCYSLTTSQEPMDSAKAVVQVVKAC